MNYNGNVKDKNGPIITEDGLFYSNFDKKTFTTVSDSKRVSYLSDTYGVKIGKPQPWSNGVISDNQVGVYIVDYEKYLSDMKEGSLGKGRTR